MIRRLDPDRDRDLYRQMWAWRESYPRSLRDATAVDSVATFEEFLEQSRGARADIGIFENEMIACLSLQWKADGVYEIHFSSRRGCQIEQMIPSFLNVQKTIFEDLQARFIFAFTPEWNRGLILLATIIGMEPDGVRRIKGSTRGKAITWIRLSQSRTQYESDTKADAAADRDGTVFTDRQFDHNEHAGGEHTRHRAAA